MFGLLCIAILKHTVMANFAALANVTIAIPIPYIYNIPLKPLSNFENIIFNVSECHEWYMFAYDNSTSIEDRNFFGSNDGNNLHDNTSTSRGMLKDGINILSTPCPELNKTVPYFEEQDNFGKDHYNESMNDFIYRQIEFITSEGLHMFGDKHLTATGLEKLPDGTIKVFKASEKQFDYTIQINDIHFP
jgi:hypothetical protein